MRSMRFLAVAVLAVILILSSAQNAFAQTITLAVAPVNPPNQPIMFSGTVTPPILEVGDSIVVRVWLGGGCQGEFFSAYLTYTSQGGVYLLNLDWGLPAGSYSAFADDTFYSPILRSACVNFMVGENTVVEVVMVPYSICVIQLGVREPSGTIAWLPGYAYPGTPISQCQNKTDVLGQDVLGRTIMFHQFIMNGTSFRIVTRIVI